MRVELEMRFIRPSSRLTSGGRSANERCSYLASAPAPTEFIKSAERCSDAIRARAVIITPVATDASIAGASLKDVVSKMAQLPTRSMMK